MKSGQGPLTSRSADRMAGDAVIDYDYDRLERAAAADDKALNEAQMSQLLSG